MTKKITFDEEPATASDGLKLMPRPPSRPPEPSDEEKAAHVDKLLKSKSANVFYVIKDCMMEIGHHASEELKEASREGDESKIKIKRRPSVDDRAKKLVAIGPGQPVAGRWRRCTRPGTNCMFRYDLSVPVPDEEHGYVEVVKILVCPLHVNEMVSCPANHQETTAKPSTCPLSEDGDGYYCTVELNRGTPYKDADCRPSVDWKACGTYLAEMAKQKKILVKDGARS